MLLDESIRPPSQYLGGKLLEVTLDNGTKAWAFGSCQYVQSAVCNVEDHLEKSGEKLLYKATTPLSTGYHPEIDVSSKLGESEASYFHSLFRVLRWIVELGGPMGKFLAISPPPHNSQNQTAKKTRKMRPTTD